MTGLTDTAYYTRRGIKYAGFGLVLFIVLKIAWGIGLAWWKQQNPPPPPVPEVKFGRLPKAEFPVSQTNPGLLSYRLETIEGIPPNLPTVGRVYFMPQANPGVLALDLAKEKAKKLGFTGDPQQIDETHYRFQNTTAATLDVDIISGSFRLSYPYVADPELLANKVLPSSSQAIVEAKSFLSRAGILGDDLKEGRGEISNWRLEGSNLVAAISLSEADFVRVDLFRTNLDELSLLPINPKQANVYFLFSGSRQTEKRIVEAGFSYAVIDRENFSTYPLKTTAQGWQELQAGQGYVADAGQNVSQITIRRIYLAYFEAARATQKFLQPIFVFEGDKNFFAYVSAVDSSATE